MPSLKELAALMQELESRIAKCSSCGTCQSVCPLFAQTKSEADVTRGKLALLEGLVNEIFINPAGVEDRLNRCLLCGSCEAACPSGVNVLEIFLKARTVLAGYTGLPLVKKIVFKWFLAHPALFDRIFEMAAKYQTLFLKQQNNYIGTSCARFVSPLLRNRHVVPLADVPFHRLQSRIKKNDGSSGIKVAFFTGCLIDKIFPRVAQASVDALQHHDINIWIPKDQGCCGIPALSSGDIDTFKQLMQYHLTLLESVDFDYLLTACATCTATIKKVWPMMTQDDSDHIKKRAARIADKTMDINQFLTSKADIKKAAPKSNAAISVTYHDPCHLLKTLGVAKEPRHLIGANGNYILNEMADAGRCCGMGGNFNIHHYNLSCDIGRQKKNNIIESGCSIVATGCPACMLQLADILSRDNKNIDVKHAIEIYAEAVKRSE